MLVIHPSSLCDVCLDPYNIASTPANVPHAIACGHIFCLTCLLALTPSACPLCRKSFHQDRVKKLHVAGPPESDNLNEQENEAEANALLQRLALVSGEDVPEENVVEVMTEVSEWLFTKDNDAYPVRALCSSLGALRGYKALQDEYERSRVENRTVKRQLRSAKHNAEQDLKTARAVEDNLLVKLQEAEDEISRLTLDTLHSEVPRAHNASNPLPTPPEPLPYELLPPFARPGGGDSDSLLHSNPHQYNTSTFQTRVGENTTVSSAASSEADSTCVPSTQPVSSRQQEFSRKDDRSRRPGQASRDIRDASGTHSTRRHSNSTRQHTQATEVAYERAVRAGELQQGRTQIIPGALPTHRIVPAASLSPPDWARVDTRYAEVEDGAGRRRDRGMRSHRIVDDRPAENSTDERAVDEVEHRMASASAYLDGYGSGYDSGYSIAHAPSGYTPTYHDGYMSEPPMQELRDQGYSSLGLLGIPQPSAVSTVTAGEDDSDAPTPVGRSNRLPIRSTLATSQSQSAAPDLSRMSLDDVPPQRAPRGAPNLNDNQVFGVNSLGVTSRSQTRGDTGIDGVGTILELGGSTTTHLSSPGSVTSWGTVHTASRGSLSDLGGLVGLQNGGVRGQGSIASSSSLSGLEEIQDEDDQIFGADNEGRTPVGVMIPHANGVGGGLVLGLLLESEGDYARGSTRRMRQRSTSYTDGSSIVDDRQEPALNHHQRRSDRESRRQHRQYASTSQANHTRLDAGTMSQNVNALALSFDSSIPMHGTSPAPRSLPDNAYRPEIVAPTPIVGGPNVLHMWANRP